MSNSGFHVTKHFHPQLSSSKNTKFVFQKRILRVSHNTFIQTIPNLLQKSPSGMTPFYGFAATFFSTKTQPRGDISFTLPLFTSFDRN